LAGSRRWPPTAARAAACDGLLAAVQAQVVAGVIDNVWLVPLLPAMSFVVILLFGKRLPRQGDLTGILAVGASFVLSVITAAQWVGREEPREAIEHAHTWLQSGGAKFEVGTHVDGLTVMMLLVVTFISLMVHVYSTGYMHGDRRYTYFYAALSLFTASMLLLVVANNSLQFLVGWELVGLCSFMLIGHWWEEKDNSDAAVKAFLTTRTGDIGLMVGIITLFFAAEGTFNIGHLNELAFNGEISHLLLLVGAACLFGGVIGKSAQFPLHTWLPDAMAGPTPVSALIHAATMVVAGVYLVARFYPVFFSGFSIDAGGVNLVAVVGAITIVIAALLAFVQDDVKKVLAYSTVSQLGYMVMALGVGAWTAGIFHLFTHAFFKALLFLAAGSLIHGVHSNNMSEMGGLRKYMPWTFRTFMIGSVALAGIPPLAGFFSKDEILLGARENHFTLMLVVGLIGAFMTAAYMTRACYLVFWGEYRGEGHPHESPPSMVVPLQILAVLSVVAGLLNTWVVGDRLRFSHWATVPVTHELVEEFHLEHAFSVPDAVLSVAVALAGIGAAYLFYFRRALKPLEGLTRRSTTARGGYALLVNKYYLDHLYTDLIVGSIKGPVARAAYWFNQRVIDGVVNGVGIASRRAAHVTYDIIDQKVVDGLVNGAGAGAEESGSVLRRIQTGRVQQYAAALFGAAAAFAVVLLVIT
jgi:NADH-quinone oxidoreductase subunit L